MADQIVITEKTSHAKDVRAAIGSRYGDVLPAEGHLFDLLEPEDVVAAWKRWSPILLRPEGLYGTRPAEGGSKAVKLKAHSPGVTRCQTSLACNRLRPAPSELKQHATANSLRQQGVALKLGARYGSRDGMLRLELTFLHLASGGGYFRSWDEASTFLQSENDQPHVGSSAVCILPATH
jgi:hypothetical protein